MISQFSDEASLNLLKQEYKDVCNGLPTVHRVEDAGNYLKIYTDILLGDSNDYLNLYLIFEDGDVGLSDSNNIYAILDDYYEITDQMLAEIANVVGLDYEEFRFTKWVTTLSLEQDIERFARIVNAIIELNKK